MTTPTLIMIALVLLWAGSMALVVRECVRRRRLAPLGRSAVYHLLIAGSAAMGLPFYWMLITSVKTYYDASAYPPHWVPIHTVGTWQKDGRQYVIIKHDAARGEMVLIPEDVDNETAVRANRVPEGEVSDIHRELYLKLGNYRLAWVAPKVTTFGQYFWVSIVTSVSTTLGTLLTGALAAFAFAKMRFRGKNLFFYIILATMMVPGQVLLIPSYIILQYLGWLDTYLALIVPWLASVFTIFLMRQFFMTIPDDLWDAAQIDGSSRLRFLFIVVLPLSKPVMITSGIFTFLGNWNSLLWPLIVTTRPEMRTIMVGLQTYNTEAGSEFHLLMAASTMAILPIIIAFFFLQKFFIAGIARTGLK
ncbi:MAG: hypothetical protein Kow0059_15420 [Candidatus Sumerlaeia bacterium]